MAGMDVSIDVDQDIAEEMKRTGVLDLTFDDEPEATEDQPTETVDVKPEAKEEKPDDGMIEVKGEKHTADEVAEALEIARNQKEWNRKNTQEAQRIKEESARLSEFKGKIDRIKEDNPDDKALLETTSVMEAMAQKIADLEARDRQRQEVSAESEARIKAEHARVEANAYFKKQGIDYQIDSIDSPEFKRIATVAGNSNPLIAAVFDLEKDKIFKASRTDNLDTIRSKPAKENEKEDYTADQKAVMKKLGLI